MKSSYIKDIALLLIGSVMGGCAVFFCMKNNQSRVENISSAIEYSQQECRSFTETNVTPKQEQCEYNNLEKEEPKEELSKPSVQSQTSSNSQDKNAHLCYPLLLGKKFSGSERIQVMKALFKRLNGEYMQCSSFEYFCYVFGNVGNDKRYKPTSEDFINWQDKKPSLQWLILKLYRLEGEKQLARGTWDTVEKCFLLDNVPIPPRKMKQGTNHIGKSYKDRIDTIIAEVMQTGSVGSPVRSETLNQSHQV